MLQKARAELTDRTRYPRDIGPILFRLAGAYHSLGQTEQAIELLLEMVEISVQGEELIPAIHAYAQIGQFRLEINDVERAKRAFAHAQQYLPLIGQTDAERAVEYRTLPLYLKTENYEEGIRLASTLLEYYRATPSVRLYILNILGQLYEKNDELEQAEEHLREGFDNVNSESSGRLMIGSSLAGVLHRLGRSDEAREVLLSLTDSEPRNQEENRIYADCLDLLATIEEERENYAVAITCLRRGEELRNEVEQTEREALRRNAQISADLRLQESQKGLDRLVRRRTELELTEVLAGLQKSHEVLASIEKKVIESLDWLTTEEMRRVILLLKELITEPATEEAIIKVSAEVQALKQLEEVSQDFFDNLEKRWPKLTTSQKQLCGMIRAGLQTSEIADLLEITHNAVWKKRKRMRKKMNLGENDDLEDVIVAIA